jgi:microcystin degradation protein MlrC
MSARVALIAAFHETNTFSPIPTDWRRFTRVYRGDGLNDAFTTTRTVVGGFLDGCQAQGFTPVPVFGAFATPAGRVTSEALEQILAGIDEGLRLAGSIDAVLLELHGAMAAEGVADPEQDMVRLIRSRAPRVPIVAVLDLHANVGAPRLEGVDVVTGYRTNPHTDTYVRGVAAAEHLSDLLRGGLEVERTHRSVPLIAAPVAQRTDVPPLAPLLARAAELESQHGFMDVTVHGGYAYADVPHLGIGISITAEQIRHAAAQEAADELAAMAWESRDQYVVSMWSPEEAFQRAVAMDGLVAVADTGDNINGGAPGDGTWLLAEALRQPQRRVLGTVWDPDVVALAQRTGAGNELVVEVGGRVAPSSGPPVTMRATVLQVGSREFTNRGPMATGVLVSMGTVAVLRCGGLDLVVQEQPLQPNDPELFRALGLQPQDYEVALLKGAAAIRAGWADVASAFVDASSPGVTDSDLSRLTFEHAPAELWRPAPSPS